MERDDDDYAAFVADMWAAESIPLHEVIVERGYSASERHIGQLVSLVEGRQGRLYVNVLEDGVRKTYRPEMHRWWRDNLPIHSSAFDGVRLGFDPSTVLGFECPALSLDEAVSPAFDRFACSDPRWVVQHADGDGYPAFTVISKILRRPDKITARSHFRFGHREDFPHAGLLKVLALPTMVEEPLDRFLAGGKKNNAH